MSRPSHFTDDATRPASTLLVGSEIALFVVHVTVVVGFSRLYRDGSYVSTLTAFVAAATLLAVGTRRLALRVPWVVLIALAGAVVVSTWLLFPGTTRWGLPTSLTWDRASLALEVSRDRFREVAAPAPVLRGFQLMAGLALWWAVWFADWAAFRLRATVEAVAPATVLFVFGALLGSGQHQVLSAVVFATAVVVFVAVHRALRAQLDERWVARSPALGPRSLLRTGVAVGAVALLAGAVVGVRLPGSDTEPLVSWRDGGDGNGDRTTVSPIVDLRRRLVDQSDTVMFTVTSDRRAYQRLTSLDRFDGQLWSSGGQFSPATEELPGGARRRDGTARRIDQEITIRNLAAIWAPAAFEARQLPRSSKPLRWDPASSTLIVDRGQATSDGLSYAVVSRTPVLDPGILDEARGPDPAALISRYEALPAGFPAVARDLAARVTADATTRYRQAIALQNWFRSEFRYSLDVAPGHGDDALVSFLRDRVGYCEQFAGAYAAMARSLGIPARVAVGFTPGDADPDGPDVDGRTQYQVRGRHAHAWPELWFPGVGWVPFEPTPGRGIPGATSYTGVPEAQDETVPTITLQTTSTTSTTVAGSPSTTAPATPDEERQRLVPVAAPESGGGGSGWAPFAAAIAAVVLGWVTAVLAAPWIRRRRRARRPGHEVLDAWDHATTAVRWKTGLAPSASETHREFARRAARPLGDLALPVAELASIATRTAWSPSGPRPSDRTRATELADQVRHAVAGEQSIATRLRRRLSWREAFGRPKT